MAKKAAVKAAGKKLTCKQFLRDLYTREPQIANDKALKLVYAKFPQSKATYKTILTWKKELRDEGINIPKQQAGAKVKNSGNRKNIVKSKKAKK